MAIKYFHEGTDFRLHKRQKTRSWLTSAALLEGYRIGDVNIIFCSDNYLCELNVKYLKHKSLTDILTFSAIHRQGFIAGDIFISAERVKENAGKYGVLIDDEMARVMVHGILHLCGYKDKSKEERFRMTERENFHLSRMTAADWLL